MDLYEARAKESQAQRRGQVGKTGDDRPVGSDRCSVCTHRAAVPRKRNKKCRVRVRTSLHCTALCESQDSANSERARFPGRRLSKAGVSALSYQISIKFP